MKTILIPYANSDDCARTFSRLVLENQISTVKYVTEELLSLSWQRHFSDSPMYLAWEDYVDYLLFTHLRKLMFIRNDAPERSQYFRYIDFLIEEYPHSGFENMNWYNPEKPFWMYEGSPILEKHYLALTDRNYQNRLVVTEEDIYDDIFKMMENKENAE